MTGIITVRPSLDSLVPSCLAAGPHLLPPLQALHTDLYRPHPMSVIVEKHRYAVGSLLPALRPSSPAQHVQVLEQFVNGEDGEDRDAIIEAVREMHNDIKNDYYPALVPVRPDLRPGTLFGENENLCAAYLDYLRFQENPNGFALNLPHLRTAGYDFETTPFIRTNLNALTAGVRRARKVVLKQVLGFNSAEAIREILINRIIAALGEPRLFASTEAYSDSHHMPCLVFPDFTALGIQTFSEFLSSPSPSLLGAVFAFLDYANGFRLLHQLGLFHGDIKADNLGYSFQGNDAPGGVIFDWGSASFAHPYLFDYGEKSEDALWGREVQALAQLFAGALQIVNFPSEEMFADAITNSTAKALLLAVLYNALHKKEESVFAFDRMSKGLREFLSLLNHGR